MAMEWQEAGAVIPERGCWYLVKTNGAEWRDHDLHLWPAPLFEHHMRPEIIRGRPIWVAKVIDPK